MTVATLLPQRDTVESARRSNKTMLLPFKRNRRHLPITLHRRYRLPACLIQRKDSDNSNTAAVTENGRAAAAVTDAANLLLVLKAPPPTMSSPPLQQQQEQQQRPSIILNRLKCSYTRRGSSSLCAPQPQQYSAQQEQRPQQKKPHDDEGDGEDDDDEEEEGNIQEVKRVSLVRAKCTYVDLIDHGGDGYESEDSNISEYDDDDESMRSYSVVSSEEEEDEGDSGSTTEAKGNSSDGRSVRFSPRCQVVEIPHYRDYSPEQKRNMWNGRKQIRAMARKNTAEYRYDGWSVDCATEEEDFVSIAGVLVHPAHLERR
jgi:hypothetical protein